jgi:putative peptidoglycan lipid II flippase
MVLGDVIIAGLLEWRSFNAADTYIVYLTLAAFSLGLLPSTASRLYNSTFYALRDTKTPAWVALVRVLLTILVGGALMFAFERFAVRGRPLGVMGLALGGGLAAWVEWGLLRRFLRARVGEIGVGAAPLARMIVAALLAALIGRGILFLLPPLPAFVLMMLILTIYGGIYFAATHLFGLEESTTVLARLARRLRG